MIKMYEMKDLVRCIDRTEENHEKLIIGEIYTIIGKSFMDGNVVYSLSDKAGNITFSTDRFELVKASNGKEVSIDEALADMPIRCDNEVVIMKGQEKKQTCAGVGVTFDGFNPVADAVNHPSHYTDGGIETIDYIQAKLTEEGFKGYLIGNITKYISRAGKKNSEVEDLKKGKWYLEKLISTVEGVSNPVEEVCPANSAITQKQIGYIAGLTKKVDLDRYNLPWYVSPRENYKELSEAEASIVIDRLIALKEHMDKFIIEGVR